MLLCRCINLLYAYIINVLCVCGLSVSDRVESGKVWARAALLVKAADAICARKSKVDQDSSAKQRWQGEGKKQSASST